MTIDVEVQQKQSWLVKLAGENHDKFLRKSHYEPQVVCSHGRENKHVIYLQIIDANIAATKLGCEGNQQNSRRVRLDKSICSSKKPSSQYLYDAMQDFTCSNSAQ